MLIMKMREIYRELSELRYFIASAQKAILQFEFEPQKLILKREPHTKYFTEEKHEVHKILSDFKSGKSTVSEAYTLLERMYSDSIKSMDAIDPEHLFSNNTPTVSLISR